MWVLPLTKARRHGATPSISISSEKLRNVLIRTIRPKMTTLSRVGATATGTDQIGGDKDLQREQDQCR